MPIAESGNKRIQHGYIVIDIAVILSEEIKKRAVFVFDCRKLVMNGDSLTGRNDVCNLFERFVIVVYNLFGSCFTGIFIQILESFDCLIAGFFIVIINCFYGIVVPVKSIF